MFDHSASLAGGSADEITRNADRALKLVESGERPGHVYVCVQNRERLLLWDHPNGQGRSVLLFSTPHQAMDYAEATGVVADVGALSLDALPRQTELWKQAGVGSFVLNRCPRCSGGVSYDLQHLADAADFLRTCAVNSVTRASKGEQIALAALSSFDDGNVAAALEQLREIRDHVECAMPQLHVLIALLAHHLQDEAEKNASLERLAYFPDYDVQPGTGHDPALLFADVVLGFRQVGT